MRAKLFYILIMLVYLSVIVNAQKKVFNPNEIKFIDGNNTPNSLMSKGVIGYGKAPTIVKSGQTLYAIYEYNSKIRVVKSTNQGESWQHYLYIPLVTGAISYSLPQAFITNFYNTDFLYIVYQATVSHKESNTTDQDIRLGRLDLSSGSYVWAPIDVSANNTYRPVMAKHGNYIYIAYVDENASKIKMVYTTLTFDSPVECSTPNTTFTYPDDFLRLDFDSDGNYFVFNYGSPSKIEIWKRNNSTSWVKYSTATGAAPTISTYGSTILLVYNRGSAIKYKLVGQSAERDLGGPGIFPLGEIFESGQIVAAWAISGQIIYKMSSVASIGNNQWSEEYNILDNPRQVDDDFMNAIDRGIIYAYNDNSTYKVAFAQFNGGGGNNCPDLIIEGADIENATVHQGEDISVETVIHNIGNQTSNSCYLGYYIGTSSDDYSNRVSRDFVASLDADEIGTESQSIHTTNLEPGTYYLNLWIDYQNAVSECNEDNNKKSYPITILAPPPHLTVDPTSLTFDASGGNQTITITSNVSWTVSDNASWLSVSPTSGSNNGIVTVTASANTGSSSRSATVTISGGGITRHVTVSQGVSANLTVTPTSLTFDASGGNQTITITSNVSWTVSDNASWLSVSPTSGSNNGIVTVTASANTGSSSRNATVTVSGGGVSRTVSVTQAGSVPIETIDVGVGDISAGCESTIEIPINIGNTSGLDIVSFTIELDYDQTYLTPFSNDEIIDISGTILPESWATMVNTNEAGKVIVAGASAYALSGSGILFKLKFTTTANEGTSQLTLANVEFNNGNPVANVSNGTLEVSCGLCGDADENGQVNAYDASYILKHAANIIVLEGQGYLNADVDMNNSVNSYDAALLLMSVAHIPTPVPTCLGTPLRPWDFDIKEVNLSFAENKYKDESGKQIVDITLDGLGDIEGVYSFQTELELPYSGNVNFIGLPDGVMSVVNKVDDTHFNIALASAELLNAEDILIRVEYNGGETGGSISFSNVILNGESIEGVVLGVNEESSVSRYTLIGNYPNPFNPTTNIVFEIPQRANVKIDIYDVLGRKIKTLVNNVYNQGRYEVQWNAKDEQGVKVSSGMYVAVMQAGNYRHSIKMNLLK